MVMQNQHCVYLISLTLLTLPLLFHSWISSLIGELYSQYKDEDGFIYIMYSGENTFGEQMDSTTSSHPQESLIQRHQPIISTSYNLQGTDDLWLLIPFDIFSSRQWRPLQNNNKIKHSLNSINHICITNFTIITDHPHIIIIRQFNERDKIKWERGSSEGWSNKS
jgi:hypothetical protein